MAQHGSEMEHLPTVAFRPPAFAEHDRVIADHPRGHSEDIARAARPGAVPPPEPAEPVSQESLLAQARAALERE
jgi:hypothetical protein